MLTKRDLLRLGATGALASALPGAALAQNARTGILPGGRHRPERLRLRPADRDELRGHAQVRDRQGFRPVQGAVQRNRPRPRHLHLQGHRGRHPQRRHALFDRLDGPARGADRHQRAGGRSETLLFRAADRQLDLQLRLYRLARDRERRRRLSRRRPRLARRDAGRDQEGVQVEFAALARDLPHPAFQPGRHRQCPSRSRTATRPARCRPFSISPPRRQRRRSTSPRSTTTSRRRISSSTSPS